MAWASVPDSLVDKILRRVFLLQTAAYWEGGGERGWWERFTWQEAIFYHCHCLEMLIYGDDKKQVDF